MKKIKLLLLALPLLLCGCENKNTTKTEPSFKQEFYNYLEENFNIKDGGAIITVGFNLTEAHTFGGDYYTVDVIYTEYGVHKAEYVIAVENGHLFKVAKL